MRAALVYWSALPLGPTTSSTPRAGPTVGILGPVGTALAASGNTATETKVAAIAVPLSTCFIRFPPEFECVCGISEKGCRAATPGILHSRNCKAEASHASQSSVTMRPMCLPGKSCDTPYSRASARRINNPERLRTAAHERNRQTKKPRRRQRGSLRLTDERLGRRRQLAALARRNVFRCA